MKILCFLFLSSFVFSQTLLNETFSSFDPDTTGTYAAYFFDATNYPDSVNADHSGNGNPLTTNGATDGQTQASILIENGYSEDFNDSGSKYRHNDAYWNVLATSGFSVFVSIRWADLTGSNMICAHDAGSGANRQWALMTSGTQLRFVGYDPDVNSFYRPKSSMATGTWYNIVAVHDTAGTGAHNVYVDGVISAESVSGTIDDTLKSFNGYAFNISGISIATLDVDADITALYIYKGVITSNKARSLGFLANGWAALDSNVTRNNFAFSQGIITDTVYYNTALTAGDWQVQVEINGNSGGETYQILTSADKSTWTALKSGTAEAGVESITVTGAGLGYIGLAVSSAADTVFFDNLTVSQPSSGAKFKQNSGYSKFKGW